MSVVFSLDWNYACYTNKGANVTCIITALTVAIVISGFLFLNQEYEFNAIIAMVMDTMVMVMDTSDTPWTARV